MADKPNYKDQVEAFMKQHKQPAKVAVVKEGLPDIPATSIYQSLSKLAETGVLDKVGTGEYVYADPQPTKAVEKPQEAPVEHPEPVVGTLMPEGADKTKEELIWSIQTTLTREAEEARVMEIALTAKGERLGKLIAMLEEAKGL